MAKVLEKLEMNILKEEKLVFHFIKRSLISLSIIAIFLAIGVTFYMSIEKMAIHDAIYHASMIITGMGSPKELVTPQAKIFTSIYAIIAIGIVVSSIVYIFEPFFRSWHRKTYREFHQKKKSD